MTDQVNEFLNSVASKPASTPWTSADSIFSFFIGINDVGDSYGNGNYTAFDGTLMNAYFALVQKVFNVGARNFLFINVPPVNRSPLMLAESTSAQTLEAAAIADYNSKLANAASSFQSANAGVRTWVYDSNTRLNTILNSPTTYGFVDATTYGSASNDVWCNNLHVSPGVHEYFAEDIAVVLKGTGF